MKFREFIENEKKQEYFKKLVSFVNQESLHFTIYPPNTQVFKAFELCDFDATRVVIIGQDPYHQPNQANGLAFSVNEHMPLPKSLINIFKELEDDLQIKNTNGSLINWAKQGVLLMNTCLTVRQNQPMSHANQGWEIFTAKWIAHLNNEKEKLIFVLWGKHASQFETMINQNKHIILKSPHPSPLSAYRGFFGSRVFSTINQYMDPPIDWRTL